MLPLNPFYHGRFTYINLPSAIDLHPGVPVRTAMQPLPPLTPLTSWDLNGLTTRDDRVKTRTRTREVEEEVDGRTERMLALLLSFRPLTRWNETKPGGWLFVFDAVRPREWGISIPGTRAWGMGRCVASMATGLVEVTTSYQGTYLSLKAPLGGQSLTGKVVFGFWLSIPFTGSSPQDLSVCWLRMGDRNPPPPPPEENSCSTFLGGGSCQRPRFN